LVRLRPPLRHTVCRAESGIRLLTAVFVVKMKLLFDTDEHGHVWLGWLPLSLLSVGMVGGWLAVAGFIWAFWPCGMD
jgi:hypothetical protein